MVCTPFKTADGASGFICGPAKRCGCGRRAVYACDWKRVARRSGTCDTPLCARCTYVPAPGKDLCPAHAAEWKARQTRGGGHR